MKICEHPARRILAALAICVAPPLLGAAEKSRTAPIEMGIECEQFEFPGDWSVSDQPQTSGGKCLVSGAMVALPAATAIEIPQAGRYHLWVRAMDFPQDRPGTRLFTVAIGGKASAEVFGDSRRAGFTWERGGEFALERGQVLVTVQARTAFARADALLLTTDPNFVPSQPLGTGGRHRRIEPRKVAGVVEDDPLAAQAVSAQAAVPVAQLANEHLRISFAPAQREGRATVVPRVAVRTSAGWTDLPANPESEIYSVVDAGPDATFDYAGFFPRWRSRRAAAETVTIEIGGAKVTTARSGQGTIWRAGQLVRFLPRAAHVTGNAVQMEFHPSPLGTLKAEWELRPGERAARVRLDFTPSAAGQYALGYHLFFRRPLAEVREILLPMMWHRHRLPEQPRTLLDPFTPTPVALAETAGAGAPSAWAIVGDPSAIPFAWPTPSRPHFGLAIRDHLGAVQPAIYGPVPGTDAARRKAGEPLHLSFRVLVQPGDWYAGFRTAADEVFSLRDYRRNVGTSLTDAALNMIDLLKDDDRGGWWQRGKGFYQIETKNGVTHASPLLLLSLYRLTGDDDLYRRRTLPTMEYVLSRRSAHFSPTPHDTGRYDAGGMDGPVRLFGTVAFAGLWDMAQRRTPAFADVALPAQGVRPTAGYSHVQPFDDWLARYEITGDTDALQRARDLADAYIEKQIRQPPSAELGAQPFFFISFVPNWEGLLRLYEATREPRYLEAAAFGARQLMTGLWSQPVIPAGDVTVHPGGKFVGDTYPSWRGPVPYRLGAPRKTNDTPEHRAPAWIVSNVGLGFEQPSTFRGSGPGRQIYQMGWAADFLRLARYTGDRAFEMHARNAVIGRWANYPGYYATGFTDLPLNPRYPHEGPDVTDFYYHHIPPHLAWTIDYLVAEAELRSAGTIAFPSRRQNGYAYFDSRVFGHAPGKVHDVDGLWLWFRRGIVSIDNPQLNYLLARRDDCLVVVLMNESQDPERARVRFAADELGLDRARDHTVRLLGGAPGTLPLHDGVAETTVPARGIVVLQLAGTRTHVPVHRVSPPGRPGAHPGSIAMKTDAAAIELRGASLQVLPGAWDAYVWCTATPDQAREVILHVASGDAWQQHADREYPFEFSIPVPTAHSPLRFKISGTKPDGTAFRSPEATLGAPVD